MTSRTLARTMSLHQEREVKNKLLNTNLKYFARHAPLYIKHKETGVRTPFEFNKAQEYIHKKLEEQLSTSGWVRAIIIKGRQQGVSTYTSARFYHKTTRQKNKRTFVLTHEADATKNMIYMVENFRQLSAPALSPENEEENAKRLKFTGIESEYQFGTAGNKEVGRSGTTDYFHGSEAAFWRNTDQIRAGALQTVRNAPGTEIIFETTANGMGGMIYEMVMQSIKGEGEYITIFVPWFWQPEYRLKPKAGYQLSEDDIKYQKAHGLDIEQMYWRHNKIIELKSITKFRQEYPATIIEAFQSSGEGLFSPHDIQRARASTITDKQAPLIMGVDPARNETGKGDRTAIAFRRGRECPKVYVYKDKMTDDRLAGIVASLIEKHNPARVFIDCGHSWGAHDILKNSNYRDKIQGVLFQSEAKDSTIYANIRAEIYSELQQWLQGDVSIPDDDELHADLGVIPDKFQGSGLRWQLPRKDIIKKDYGLSPDLADALALTFTAPVHHNNNDQRKITRTKSLKTSR